MSPTALKGSSWDHPRGHAPMVATATEYEARSGGSVSISWVARTLKEFGTVPVDSLAQLFDLIVIDHPHVGEMAASGCVVPLDDLVDRADLDALAHGSPGGSHQSYQYGGHQWALAIDAACQTSAWRPDLIGQLPATWAEVIELARDGHVLWPLCDVDAAASFLTLMAAAGSPCATDDDRLADRDIAEWALGTMRSVANASDPRCLVDNPIAVLEALARSDDYVYSPLAFCYVHYSRPGHPGHQVAFGDIPTLQAGQAPAGSLLGGAGLAVSSYSDAVHEAVEYTHYVASAGAQCGTYFASGGQPAHGQAWRDADLDEQSGRFFSGVARTINGAWTRPNVPVFAGFQNEMIDLFHGWFEASKSSANNFLDELDALYRRSRRANEGTTSTAARPRGSSD